MAIGTQYNLLIDASSAKTKLIRGMELLKYELEVLLGFDKYTLFFGNNIGLNANQFLHLPNNLATFNLVKAQIEKLLLKYGRVKLVKTEMTFNKENSTLEVTLMLAPRSNVGSTFNVSLTLGE